MNIRTAASLLFLTTISAHAEEMTGKQAMSIYDQCGTLALQKCGRNTIYCRSYRRAFVKSCMLENNVPVETILLLLSN